MMARPRVLPEAFPVLEALDRLRADIGSAEARDFGRRSGLRLLCVAVDDPDFDYDAVPCAHLLRHLRYELRDEPVALALTRRVFVRRLFPFNAALILFPDIPPIEATLQCTIAIQMEELTR
jgi:hypothetical protein